MIKNYMMNLRLSQFIGSRVVKLENQEGIEEQGVFIPFEQNGLKLSKQGHVNVNCFVNMKTSVSFDMSTHYIIPRLNKEVQELQKELGYDYTPCIGSMKDSKFMMKKQLSYIESQKKVNKVSKSYLYEKE